jgi:hypothetical protein
VHFPDLSADEVWVEVSDEALVTHGFAHAMLEPGGSNHVVVELVERGLALTVVDPDGEPLPEAQVDVATLDGDSPWSVYRDVDSQGRALFRGIPWDRVLVHATEPAAGTAVAAVDLAPEGLTEHELVLGGGADLRVLVQDGHAPVSGVAVALHPVAPSVFIAERQTGVDGLAAWNRVQPGDYQVSIDHPGIWPTWHAFSFDGSAEPVEVPVRRLGSLRIQVGDAQGQALPGLPLDVRSVELGETVASWLAGHQVSASPMSLTTDPQGELLLEGLPRGPYTVQLTTPAGEVVGVTVDVKARETTTRTIALE